jgi:hypothetical protein
VQDRGFARLLPLELVVNYIAKNVAQLIIIFINYQRNFLDLTTAYDNDDHIDGVTHVSELRPPAGLLLICCLSHYNMHLFKDAFSVTQTIHFLPSD